MTAARLKNFAELAWGDARKNGLTFVHVHHERASTHDRVTAVLDAFGPATRDLEQGPVEISYLVHCDADVSVANERYREAIRTYSDGENKLRFMTFASWGGSAGRQVVVIDADRATTSSMDYLVMLRITQELGARAKEGGLQCLVVSVSDSPSLVVWRAETPPWPRKFFLDAPDLRETSHDANDWLPTLLSMLKKKLEARLEVLGPQQQQHLQHLIGEDSGPTVVLLMRYEDAWGLFRSLTSVSQGVEFGCITPWSGQSDITRAISPSPYLKLIHIDDGVRMMPLIENAEVFVGAEGFEFSFLHKINITFGISSALGGYMRSRRQAAAALSSDPSAVHVFGELEARAEVPEPAELAFGPQRTHLLLGLINDCNGINPVKLPVRIPNDRFPIVDSAMRLAAWGLAESDEVAFRQPVVTHPLGTQTVRFLRFTPNINAAVMLGCIGGGMPGAVANILVDMAVMVCQGPSTVFHTATRNVKLEVLRELDSLGGPLVKLIHKGQLWLSVACLDLVRGRRLPHELAPFLRSEVLSRVLDRAAEIKRHIGITTVDRQQELSGADVEVVEEQLARAFVSNILLAGRIKRYAARDFVTCKLLSRPADDVLDWDRLGRESDRRGVVAGVYTYLERTSDPDAQQKPSFEPHDVTVVSLGAVWKALLWVPNHEALRTSMYTDAGRAKVDRYLGSPDGATPEVTGGATKEDVPAAAAPEATQDFGVDLQDPSVSMSVLTRPAPGKFRIVDDRVGLQDPYVSTSGLTRPAPGRFRIEDDRTWRHPPTPWFRPQ